MKFYLNINQDIPNLPYEIIDGITRVKKLIKDDIMKRYLIEKLKKLSDENLWDKYEIVDVKIKIKRKDK